MLSFEGPFCISVSTEAGKKRPREETRFFSLKSPLTTAWGVMRAGINLVRAKWLHYEMRSFQTTAHGVLSVKAMQGLGTVSGGEGNGLIQLRPL